MTAVTVTDLTRPLAPGENPNAAAYAPGARGALASLRITRAQHARLMRSSTATTRAMSRRAIIARRDGRSPLLSCAWGGGPSVWSSPVGIQADRWWTR